MASGLPPAPTPGLHPPATIALGSAALAAALAGRELRRVPRHADLPSAESTEDVSVSEERSGRRGATRWRDVTKCSGPGQ